jgi:hypothetical protein
MPGRPGRAEGEILNVMGRMLNKGEPVRNAKVEGLAGQRSWALMALFGPHAMSDLSPEYAPKRTSAGHSEFMGSRPSDVSADLAPARDAEEYEGGLTTMNEAQLGTLLVMQSNLSVQRKHLLSDLALKHRLPASVWTTSSSCARHICADF